VIKFIPIACLIFPAFVLFNANEPGDLQQTLLATDYWENVDKQKRKKWSDPEKARLEELSRNSNDKKVRLRASKLIVEFAGNASLNVGVDDAAIAIAGFRFLEANLDNPHVKKMLETGITHYHVSSNTTRGGVWFLVESLGIKHSCGINLRWDSSSKSMVEIVAWGEAK